MRFKNNITIIFFILVLTLSMLSCSHQSSSEANLDEQIGQMLLFGFKGLNVDDNWVQTFTQQITDLNIGGVLVLSYNVKSPTQLDSLMNHFKQIKSNLPILYAIDQEGGKVQRLSPQKGFQGFPSAQYTAENLCLEEAYNSYYELANECKDYGFNLILAPVVDLNINPQSPAIGNLERSYSNNPMIVSSYATAFINAIKDNGLISCLKHFPGHGSASNDSHLDITDVTQTWSEIELDPYITLINQNLAQAIMSAHIFNTNIDENYPSSLSDSFINNLLRNELQYDGVVITDDLQMGAIQNYYELEDTIIKSINAGSDILIFSQYFEPNIELPTIVHNIIKNAVQSKTISKKRIEQSYYRIKQLKNQIW